MSNNLAASCACQTIWLRRILMKLELPQNETFVIYCDNISTIKLYKNPVLHGRSKHIDIRFHINELSHCITDKQVADIMKKPLKTETFQRLLDELGDLVYAWSDAYKPVCK